MGQLGLGTPMGDPIGTPIAITKQQKELFQRIVAENMISCRKFADNLGINESAVKKHLNSLKNKGGTETHRRNPRLLRSDLGKKQ